MFTPQSFAAEKTSYLFSKLFSLNSINDSIILSWDSDPCTNATGYKIYRHEGPSEYEPDSCETGIGSLLDFIKIGEADLNRIFIDNNNGEGLIPGIEYCYRVVAEYSDGALSIVSDEACATLDPGSPPLTNISVYSDENKNIDSIYLSWITPEVADSISGPYDIRINRSDFLKKENLDLLEIIENVSLNDTTYSDDLPKSQSVVPFSYSVELYGEIE